MHFSSSILIINKKKVVVVMMEIIMETMNTKGHNLAFVLNYRQGL